MNIYEEELDKIDTTFCEKKIIEQIYSKLITYHIEKYKFLVCEQINIVLKCTTVESYAFCVVFGDKVIQLSII